MHRILILHDVEQLTKYGVKRWAYANRSYALCRHAPPDLRIGRCSVTSLNWGDVRRAQYDLVFNLDYSMAESIGERLREVSPNTIYVVSFNRDSQSRTERYLPAWRAADWLVVNNRDRWLADEGPLSRTCCIANGIDDLWQSDVPIGLRPHRVLWTGSIGPNKGKGCGLLRQLKEQLAYHGFSYDFLEVDKFHDENVLTPYEMREFYNSGSYILCVSESEGTPNYLLEAMACGCVPVTTAVGNVLEFGRVGALANCVITGRDVDSVIEALKYARERRKEISAEAHRTVHEKWTYGPPGNRAEYFYALFRALIKRGPDDVNPFCYLDVSPERI